MAGLFLPDVLRGRLERLLSDESGPGAFSYTASLHLNYG